MVFLLVTRSWKLWFTFVLIFWERQISCSSKFQKASNYFREIYCCSLSIFSCIFILVQFSSKTGYFVLLIVSVVIETKLVVSSWTVILLLYFHEVFFLYSRNDFKTPGLACVIVYTVLNLSGRCYHMKSNYNMFMNSHFSRKFFRNQIPLT